ncbi:hypothetical protein BB560_004066 [Smittium megazygosporum]|uniref:t-SNARE coiled-coil homology domain-containing protein n=1 Tax=Smittium megazygosporum TaxID=133381 RepID=A0A2T9ZAB3_9FUNG|nr:hypothetical protein BB560_004066 [Smittium megazygosporum]
MGGSDPALGNKNKRKEPILNWPVDGTYSLELANESSNLFASYEVEFQDLTSSIIPKLENSFLGHSGEQKRIDIKSTQMELEEAEELVGQMELELMNLSGSEKTQAAPRLKRYKVQILGLKREMKSAINKIELESNRAQLLDQSRIGVSSGGSNKSGDYDQRSRLLEDSERLERSGRRLQDSHRIAIETEAVGANILNDLRLQREQIVNTRGSLMQADSHIDSSQRTLKSMARRLTRD